MRQFVVLKPSGPMRLANASFKIRQGQVVPHPGYPLAEGVFDIFDDTEEGRKAARACAAKNAELKNTATRHGVTSKQTLAKLYAKEAKDAPSATDRKKAFENAKVLTKEGLVNAENNSPAEDTTETPEQELARLREEITEFKKDNPAKKEKVSTGAYLDQNTRTVVKRVKTAVSNKKLKKKDVEDIIKAEESGQARKGILDKLKNLVTDDAIFGKLFNKKK